MKKPKNILEAIKGMKPNTQQRRPNTPMSKGTAKKTIAPVKRGK